MCKSEKMVMVTLNHHGVTDINENNKKLNVVLNSYKLQREKDHSQQQSHLTTYL